MSKIEKIENKMKKDQEEQRPQQQEQLRQKYPFELEGNETEVREMYMSAVKYYRSHDFGKAREEFLKVNEKIPGYGFTQGYLSRIDQELALKPAVVVTAPAAVVKIPRRRRSLPQWGPRYREPAKTSPGRFGVGGEISTTLSSDCRYCRR